VAGRVALQGGEEDFAGPLLAGLRDPLLVLQQDGPGLLLQLRVEHLQEPLGGFLAVQPAQLVEGLPLQVEELDELFLASVDFLDPLGELALGLLDDLLLLAQLIGLLLEGVLALVHRAFPLVQLLAQGAELLLALGLLLDRQLFELQLRFPPPAVGLLLRALDDLPGLAFRVPAPQIVQQLDENEGQPGRHHAQNEVQNDLSEGTHDRYPP